MKSYRPWLKLKCSKSLINEELPSLIKEELPSLIKEELPSLIKAKVSRNTSIHNRAIDKVAL